MASEPSRRDAHRNRQRIVAVGRRYVDEGTPIQLNDVAKAASVGVATVYRHFPNTESLMEAVAAPGLERLETRAEQALAEADPWTALEEFLLAAAHASITDASIPAVMAAPSVLPATTERKQRLGQLFGELLERAQAGGVVSPTLTAADVAPLMCAVAYAARLRDSDSVEARAAHARRYLSILLRGAHQQP